MSLAFNSKALFCMITAKILFRKMVESARQLCCIPRNREQDHVPRNDHVLLHCVGGNDPGSNNCNTSPCGDRGGSSGGDRGISPVGDRGTSVHGTPTSPDYNGSSVSQGRNVTVGTQSAFDISVSPQISRDCSVEDLRAIRDEMRDIMKSQKETAIKQEEVTNSQRK